jgi:hypothetical protein
MANFILLASSFMMIGTHMIAIYAFSGPILLQYVFVIGSFTSIWNHSTTCIAACWTDRIVMCVGLCVDIWFIIHLPFKDEAIVVGVLIGCSVVCYACGKRLGSLLLHLYSHMFVCLSHFSLLVFYHCSTCKDCRLKAETE